MDSAYLLALIESLTASKHACPSPKIGVACKLELAGKSPCCVHRLPNSLLTVTNNLLIASADALLAVVCCQFTLNTEYVVFRSKPESELNSFVKILTSGSIVIVVLLGIGCAPQPSAFPPEHYLLITHPALNRLTIYDLHTNKLIGALPTHKLPHDMLVSHDSILYVVNSGSQCIMTFDLKSPEFWSYARDFMNKDSVNLYTPRTPSANMMGREQSRTGEQPARDTIAWTALNRDPVQLLPESFSQTYLTDTTFPEIANPMHTKVNAFAHKACYDCHDRSVGGRPFGPSFSKDSSEIRLVHLRGRNVTVLDSKTLAVRRQIPLPIPQIYSPIETLISPDHNEFYVTCRNEIGESKRGIILVVDLQSGKLLKTVTAGIYPWHLLLDASSEKVYVNNFQSSRISVFDISKEEIVDSLIVQNGPSMMTFWPGHNVLVVSCFYTDRVLFVDLRTKEIVKAIEVDSNPTSLEFSGDGKSLFVLCGGAGSLDIVDVERGSVRERHKTLFGAYAFHSIDTRYFEN